MSVQIKVARLLGAVLVTLALVPWLGSSPAAATGGGSDKGSSTSQGHDNSNSSNNSKADKTAKDVKAAKDDKAANAAKSEAKAHVKAESSKADKKPAEKAGVTAGRGSAKNSSRSNQKVTLCHRTNSDHNPYVRITVSINSVIKSSGHDGHNGPVYAAGMKRAHQKWGDIIPAFSYHGGSYPGQNWAAGAAIFGAGCAVPTGGGHTTPPPTITVTATPSGGGGGTSQKVTLCHRTNSETNPYVRITVSVNSVVKTRGHDGHNGPIFAAGLKAAHQKWGDIIPSFTYTTKTGGTASYGGKNWPAGKAFFDAGCRVSQPTTTQFGTTSVSPTATQTVTTTVTGPNGTATVTQTVTSDTSVLPTKIGDDDTDVLGGSTGVLPHTGLDLPLGAALGLSFLLLLAGGALMVVPSRVNTERNRRH